jgi:VWFA-related protein
MTQRITTIGLLITSFAVSGLTVIAQSGRVRERPRQTDNPGDSFKLRVEEVLLPVSVRTSSGSNLGTLHQSDLVVTEDGERRVVTSVMRTPANVLFILDVGGEGVLKNINLNRDLALKMIDQLGPDDQAAILTYGDRVNLISGWTKDRKALRDAIKWKVRPGLACEFYAGLMFAADEVLQRVSGRRNVVLMTDGVDSFDNHSFERALAALHRSRATLYVASHSTMLMKKIKPDAFNPFTWLEMIDAGQRARIGFLRIYYKQLEAAEVTLKGFAEETGGIAFYPLSETEFTSLDRQILSEMNTEYIIAYQSQRPVEDAAFHSTRVIPTRVDLQVRSRRGVYSNVFRPEAKGSPGPPAAPKPKSTASLILRKAGCCGAAVC